MVAAGGIVYAADMNKALARRTPYAHVADVASSAAIAATEVAALTVPSTAYKANTAYEVVVEGFYIYAATTANAYARLRKFNATPSAGALVCEFTRIPDQSVLGNHWLQLSRRFTTTAAVTTALSFTLATAASTVTMVGTAGQQRQVNIFEIGDQSAFVDDPALT